MNETSDFDAVKPWRRLAAAAIDIILLFPLNALLQELLSEELAWATLAVFIVIALLFSWRLFGASPGMALMDCTLINKAGQRPDIRQLGMRLTGILIAALPAGIGFLWILKGPQHQGWQDKFSGTAMIIDDEGRKSIEQLERECQ